jgi:hypothetical protein
MLKKFLLLIFISSFSFLGASAETKSYMQAKLLDYNTRVSTSNAYNSIGIGRFFSGFWGIFNFFNLNHTSPQRTKNTEYLMTVETDEIIYELNYDPLLFLGERPVFIVGDPINVRLNDKQNRMFIQFGDDEIKAKIMRAIRKERAPSNFY